MLEVIKSGLFDSIQDMGRFGVQEFGVPNSGVMDQFSAGMANSILGNDANDAVMEITINGPELKFYKETEICITGADLSVSLNDRPIKRNTRIIIKPNDLLRFGKRVFGCRAYLAIKQGFKSEIIMNSRSWLHPVTEQSRLQKGDGIPYSSYSSTIPLSNASIKDDPNFFENNIIQVFKGPEFSLLEESNISFLLNNEFTILNSSNRMAYQLQEKLSNDLPEMITSLALPGTVQLTPSGQMIILMRDGQVTGGYPRIFQLSEASVNRLSQKIFGQKSGLNVSKRKIVPNKIQLFWVCVKIFNTLDKNTY